MKKRLCLLFLLLACFGGTLLYGQQYPISNFYPYVSNLYNPAGMGTTEFNRVFLLHQQRKTFFPTLSNNQFLTFSSAASSDNRIGWGAFIMNDWDFVEHRITGDLALSYHVFYRDKRAPKDDPRGDVVLKHTRISMGASVGFINWNLDFSKVPVTDRSEVNLIRQSVTKPNLSFGIDGDYYNDKFKIEAGGAIFQLPDLLFILEARDTLITVPHIMAHGAFLWNLGDSIGMGPVVFYRNIFGRDYSLPAAFADVGVKTEFRKYNLWTGLGYRLTDVAVHGSMGWQVASRDTSKKGRYFPQRWEIAASIEVPLNGTITFGPSFELGLGYHFGQLRKVEYDTIQAYRGPVWANTANLNEFLEEKVDTHKTLPNALLAKSDYSERYVTLTYEFEDDSFEYDPSKMEGVENLLRHLVQDLLYESFYPEDERDQEYADYLSKIEYIQFATFLKDDDISARFLADADSFAGPPMVEEILHDGKIREIGVEPGRLTNFQVAYMKMSNMRDRMQDMLENHYNSPEYQHLARPYIDFINIETSYPNLESWQKNVITIRFKKQYRKRPKLLNQG